MNVTYDILTFQSQDTFSNSPWHQKIIPSRVCDVRNHENIWVNFFFCEQMKIFGLTIIVKD